MAAKRRAGKQLTQDNWDQEEEPEEVGVFEKAPEDVLKNRVIRTAKRRGVGPSSNEEGSTKSIFSGFSGFSSSNSNNGPTFSFLKSSKTTDTAPAGDTKTPSFGFLSNAKSSSDTVKDSGDAPFEPFAFLNKSKLSNGTNGEETKFSSSFLSKTTSSLSDSNKSSFFAPDRPKNESTSTISQPKLQELSKQLKKSDDKPFNKNTSGSSATDDTNPEEIFLRKLKSLNLLCAEWILEHLNENPHCILTPVFDDYKKHLNQLKEERQAKNATSGKRAKIETTKAEVEVKPPPTTPFKAPDFKESLSKVNFGTSFFNRPQPQPESMFGNNEIKPSFEFNKSTKSDSDNVFKPTSNPLFSFGSNTSSLDSKTDNSESDKPKTTPTFSFTANDSSNQFKSPFFNAATTSSASDNSKPAENNEDNDDQPPVQEDVTITEEGSVFDKKCKVFIKKDGNYVDHGVGFLFLKLIGEEKKCQLIVRANNKLANIIINVLITSNLPALQKQGKNNVMLVCYPTPEATKPSAVLLKVKTSEDADQLLDLMNKYKK